MELSLQRWGLLRRLGGRLDHKIEKVGLQQAMVALVNRTGAPLVVKGKTAEVDKALSESPVLLLSNHPGESDVVTLIAGINDRPDINMVIDSSFLKILPHWDKHLIPVYVHHHDEGEDNRGQYKGWLFRQIHANVSFSQEVAHKKNIESIRSAAEKVSRGELVVMYPSAGRKNGKWFSGVGYLVNQIQSKSNAKVIMAYIDGASDWDYFKMIPLIGRFFGLITIHFSPPLSVNSLRLEDPKETAKKIERIYKEWVSKSTWHRQN
ncbi:hypothetical protein M1116_02605 [Patescibacteria group bacterium]|nr:hypothetical protein [Patescibacteria group bacterium]